MHPLLHGILQKSTPRDLQEKTGKRLRVGQPLRARAQFHQRQQFPRNHHGQRQVEEPAQRQVYLQRLPKQQGHLLFLQKEGNVLSPRF